MFDCLEASSRFFSCFNFVVVVVVVIIVGAATILQTDGVVFVVIIVSFNLTENRLCVKLCNFVRRQVSVSCQTGK